MYRSKINGKTLLVYLLGNVVLAFGVCLNTKTALGVSPVTSVAFNISQITAVPFGVINFFYLCVLIGIQYLLLKGAFQRFQLTQILASFLSSFFLQLFDDLIVLPQALPIRLLALVIGVALTGFGASLTVGMRLIPNPADALAETVGRVLHRPFGFGKNVLDSIAITVSIVLGLFFKGSFLGIGIGTVVAMALTGRVIALCHPWTERLYQRLTD